MGRLKENSPTSPIGGLALNRFWLARWLRERDVEAYVIYPSSIAVSREHRRAKTDRLDTELLMRAFSVACGVKSATAWRRSRRSKRRRKTAQSRA